LHRNFTRQVASILQYADAKRDLCRIVQERNTRYRCYSAIIPPLLSHYRHAFSFAATEVWVPPISRTRRRCRITRTATWIWRRWRRPTPSWRRRGWTTPHGIVSKRSASDTPSRPTAVARIQTMLYRISVWRWLRARCKCEQRLFN